MRGFAKTCYSYNNVWQRRLRRALDFGTCGNGLKAFYRLDSVSIEGFMTVTSRCQSML